MARDIVKITTSGDFKKTYSFLKKIKDRSTIADVLDSYGQQGVSVLSSGTPVRTGKTASSWYYEKRIYNSSISLEWYNSNLSDDGSVPVVVLIIKGHGTRTGGYVPPNDFVTPAMESLCQEAADAVWKVVTSL